MYNRELKIVGGVLLVAGAVWQFIEGNIGNGIFLTLLAAIVILLLFFNEFIILALFQMQKNNLPKAESYLDKIKAPHKLVKKQHAYFHFLKGNIAAQTNLNIAEKHFKEAMKIGLKSNQDKAMVRLGLAGVAMSKRRKMEATKLLNEAKKLDEKKMLTEQIRMYKQHLKKI